jgi:hypothetical protein
MLSVDDVYVPLSIRSRSRVASWLWRVSAAEGGWNRDALGFRKWCTYERLRGLARWLP